MGNKFTLQDCIDLAVFAHRHQYDKAGAPYINHPLRVLNSVQAQGAPAYVQMAAVLHDVTEDTPFTCDMLLTLGVPDAAVNIVRLVDRDASKQKYTDFILDSLFKSDRENPPHSKERIDKFYYSEIRNDPGALQVKLADIGDNTQPWRLVYLPEKKQEYLRDKYDKAIKLLTGETK